MPKRSSTKRRSSAVLHLGPDWAEWYGPLGRGRYGSARAQVHGRGVEDLAEAAQRARKEAGGRAVPCVLALEGELVHQRVLKLPPLAPAERKQVCLRKAASMLDADPKQTAFVAAPMYVESDGDPDDRKGSQGGAQDGEEEGEQRWMIVAEERERTVRLLAALRRKGIRVRRVTVARLARLSAAQKLRGDPSAACAVIDVEPDSVSLSLIVGTSVAHQTQLEGDLAGNPSMTLAVVQELRSLDSYWSRTHRGGRVAQVLLIGLDPTRAAMLLQALDSAAPEADITALPDVPEVGEIDPEATAGTGRLESLRSCAESGPFTPDLTLHVPAPHTHVLVLLSCLLVIAVGLGALIYGRLSERLLRLEQRRHAVAFEARDLGRVAADNLRAQGTVEGIRAELERLEHAGNLGLPLERTLRDALTAFDRDAALLSLSADSTDGRVLLGGVTESDPVASVLHLERVRAALVERGGYTAVEVGSPTPFGSDGALLNFSVRAQRSGGVPDPLAPGGRERAR